MGGEMAVCVSCCAMQSCTSPGGREACSLPPCAIPNFRRSSSQQRHTSQRRQQPPPRRRNHGVNRIGSTLDRHRRSHAPPVAVQYARACYHTIGKRGKMKVI